MSNRPSLDDYIDVAERILAFKEKHPEGSLQTVDWSVTEVGGKTFVVYQAAAFRAPDDPRPGYGIAWEPFPGPTPYTKDSELMNAETAAWGRAIVAIGVAANRKIASKQEVRARQGQTKTEPAKPPLASAEQRVQIQQRSDELMLTGSDLADAICLAAGTTAPEFKSLDEAMGWCERALGRLPARLVDPVLAKLEQMAGKAEA